MDKESAVGTEPAEGSNSIKILPTARGKWDIEKLWSMNSVEIMDTLEKLKTRPKAHGVSSGNKNDDAINDPAGQTMSLDFVIDYIRHCAGYPSETSAANSEMVPVSGYVAATTELPQNGEEEEIWTPQKQVTDPWFFDDEGTRDYDVRYGNKELPVRTVFDALGWILSITTGADPERKRTQSNFYLPLIGLYAKWCDTLMNGEYQPTMYHISWWKDGSNNGKTNVLLGATPGGDHSIMDPKLNGALVGNEEQRQSEENRRIPDAKYRAKNKEKKQKINDELEAISDGTAKKAKRKELEAQAVAEKKEAEERETRYEGFRGLDVIVQRQHRLLKAKITPPRKEELIITRLENKLEELGDISEAEKQAVLYELNNKLYQEGNTGYGRCAESFVYIVLGEELQAKKAIPEVFGFAINSTQLYNRCYYEKTAINFQDLVGSFAAPCRETCALIIKTDFDGKIKMLFGAKDFAKANEHTPEPAEGKGGKRANRKTEQEEADVTETSKSQGSDTRAKKKKDKKVTDPSAAVETSTNATGVAKQKKKKKSE